MCEDAGCDASGLFVDPGPQDATPADTDQTHHPIAVRQPEKARADECSRKEPEFAPENREQQTSKDEFFKERSKNDILQQTDHRERTRSPYQIFIEPFSPVACQLPVFRHTVHQPLSP